MHRTTNPNFGILESAVDQLGELADHLVFLGGCATGLLLTDFDDMAFRESLPGHMPGDGASQARVPLILQRVREIAAL